MSASASRLCLKTVENDVITARKFLVAVALAVAAVSASTGRAAKLKVGVVQTVIENRLEENRAKIERFIDEAKEHGCRLVVFPENALYWADISTDKATKADIDRAVERIRNHADRADLCVVFGTSHKPSDGAKWRNKGFVFGSDGKTLISCWKTKDVPESFNVDQVACNVVICSDRTFLEYSDLPCLVQGSQVIIDISGGHGGDDGRPDLRWIRYRPWATRTSAYVIVSNPVHDDTDFMGNCPWGGGSAIVRPDGSIQASRTHEKDVMFVEEIADLAANRGMYLHFHISYKSDASADDAILRMQRNLLMLRYAKYAAAVNAADPSDLPNPSSAAGGMSLIVSRQGGHEQAAPAGIEYYLPYQTSLVKGAGTAETMICATRRTTRSNDLDLDRHHRNRDRRSRPQQGWYDWITLGAGLTTEQIEP